MANFQAGETVICSITVKTSAGVLTSPATSMTITIKDDLNKTVVDDQAMDPDTTGLYHYDYTIATTAIKGTSKVEYKATDGTRITIGTDTFGVE